MRTLKTCIAVTCHSLQIIPRFFNAVSARRASLDFHVFSFMQMWKHFEFSHPSSHPSWAKLPTGLVFGRRGANVFLYD